MSGAVDKPSGRIRLILIDIDGTLTGTGGAIHPAIWPALEAARARGVGLALCTGRPGLAIAAEHARAVSPDGYHVFQNGAVVSTVGGPGRPARTGFVSELPPVAYRGLVEAARAESEALEVYTPQALFLERDEPLTREHAQLIGLEVVMADLLTLEGPIVRAQWVVPEDRLPRLREITLGLPDLEMATALQVDMPGVTFSSVTRLGTSKVTAAAWLAEHHGTTLERTAMVGDGDNDLSTMSRVGLGIAMGNATDRVKAAIPTVVGDVDSGGLAEAVYLALDA